MAWMNLRESVERYLFDHGGYRYDDRLCADALTLCSVCQIPAGISKAAAHELMRTRKKAIVCVFRPVHDRNVNGGRIWLAKRLKLKQPIVLSSDRMLTDRSCQ
jgi:hypothetical protein